MTVLGELFSVPDLMLSNGSVVIVFLGCNFEIFMVV